jgi:ABC-type phosphate/phosphonate transport system substrate-binding protein
MGDSADGKKVLQDLYGIDKMVPANAADYIPLRDAARALGIN